MRKKDDTILELPENNRLTLWFDSCIFDQTILMRLLYLLSRRTAALPEVLLYCCDGNCLTEKDFKGGEKVYRSRRFDLFSREKKFSSSPRTIYPRQ